MSQNDMDKRDAPGTGGENDSGRAEKRSGTPLPTHSTALLFLRADSPVHVGTGATLSVVDLPIAREKLTNFPIIPGSGLKGALRQKAGGCLQDDEVVVLFGPETEHASEHGGAVSMSDARTLLFPVRSAKGLFAWITCPTAIHRLLRDVDETPLRETCEALWRALEHRLPAPSQAYCSGDCCTIDSGDGANSRVVVEEFSFQAAMLPPPKGAVSKENALATFASTLLMTLGLSDDPLKLSRRLLILNDDIFRHLVLTATEVNTRVALSPETKTASDGALFVVEDLPAETFMYSRLTFFVERRPPAKGEKRRPAETMRKLFEQLAGEGRVFTFQVGGHETIGRGCLTAWLR